MVLDEVPLDDNGGAGWQRCAGGGQNEGQLAGLMGGVQSGQQVRSGTGRLGRDGKRCIHGMGHRRSSVGDH